MLALRPLDAHPRGRSRHVSHAALARHASEERRRTPDEKSGADYYDSPPSPPSSLVDQVHVAYAHDDIHLAKILLLRLKGIHVTAPDDPRIAAVKDEDFDFCFVPHGRLMDDEDEKALQERQRQELERVSERRRLERLRDCERIWEQGKARLREAKALAKRLRDAEERRRVEEQQQQQLAEEHRCRRRSRLTMPVRTVVSYKLVASTQPPADEPKFVYDFMMPRPAISKQPSKSKSPLTRPLFDDSRTVPFSTVLASMQGPLFPPESRPASSAQLNQHGRRRREAELLDSLLKVVEWEVDERRRRKGKAPEQPALRRRDSTKSTTSRCAACSSPSPSSSVSPAPSRRSWLSFSSASSSTASTAATTPSSSPPSSSWPSKSVSPTRTKPWFLASPSRRSHQPAPVLHACKPCAHLSPVAPADCPLPLSAPISSIATPPAASPVTPPTDATDDAHSPAGRVLRHLAHVLDLAKGFQHAYMQATMFAIATPPHARDDGDDDHASALLLARLVSTTSTLTHAARPLPPHGQRVRTADVQAFLAASACTASPPHPHPIPLRACSPSAAGYPVEDDADPALPPHTVLPSPLPYTLHFKPHPVPPRAPFRVLALAQPPQPAPSSCSAYGYAHAEEVQFRIRTVENPLFLRARAMENAFVRAGGWERPLSAGGAMGGGREKVLRIACEGIGRSGLAVLS
ncbi:hypothetical protein H0H81_003071 [Sphagnurus paluster]|uniref:Uncharacterized protein n=1 Tax=Sphagnurus paluster TaxID=117069 RepID=A0A9P7GMP9_9AGAR|nr:hypothetical protein H0H81_003071 [Sphagnurus paluster]